MMVNVYVQLLRQSHDPRVAFDLCVDVAAKGITHLLHHGIDPETAFRTMGLRLHGITREGALPNIPMHIMTKVPERLVRNLIFIPDTVTGVPDPDCMIRHLPSGREPTEDEIRRAWEACRR